MNQCAYSDPIFMKNIIAIKRYIDDGTSLFNGNLQQFVHWISELNIRLARYGLNVDEHLFKIIGSFIPFLDIQYCFDKDGHLQTDLFIKPTDSRSYLYFSSAHPNHIYSGIVYSQFLHLRRIINSDIRLENRINDLKQAFIDAHYPKGMIDNIKCKVLNSQRCLDRRLQQDVSEGKILPIKVVSTFDCDAELVDTVKKYENHFENTKSFKVDDKESDVVKPPRKTFQYVKKTGCNIRNRVVKVKNIALGKRFGVTKSCGIKKCECCKIINKSSKFKVNGKIVKSAPGSCTTYNVIYLALCKICGKPYTGRTTRIVRERMGEHRRAFLKIINGNDKVDLENDEFSIGAHLHSEHGLKNYSDFNDNISVCILENCSPNEIELKEHKYIHLLKTLRPLGMNTNNPFKIPLFH